MTKRKLFFILSEIGKNEWIYQNFVCIRFCFSLFPSDIPCKCHTKTKVTKSCKL